MTALFFIKTKRNKEKMVQNSDTFFWKKPILATYPFPE